MTTDNDTSKTMDETAATAQIQASETDKLEAPEALPQQEAAAAPATALRSPALRYMAIGGAVCTLLAWAFLVFSEWASMSFDVVAIVLSAIACRLQPGNMRNLAITSVIAAGTLALVFVTLFIGLHILENL